MWVDIQIIFENFKYGWILSYTNKCRIRNLLFEYELNSVTNMFGYGNDVPDLVIIGYGIGSGIVWEGNIRPIFIPTKRYCTNSVLHLVLGF